MEKGKRDESYYASGVTSAERSKVGGTYSTIGESIKSFVERHPRFRGKGKLLKIIGERVEGTELITYSIFAGREVICTFGSSKELDNFGVKNS